MKLLLTALFGLCLAAAYGQEKGSISDRSSLDRYIYPLAPAQKCPPVEVDSSDLPEAAAWGDAAKTLVEHWYPVICGLLSTQDYHSPSHVRLVIKKHIDAPAYTEGDTITIDGQWITGHPNDLGMIIHELTHVIQHYHGDNPGWLVEGIADFVRWWRYEPSPPGPRFSATATYHDSYRTTAAFLAWVSEHYDQRIVPQIDLAMRNNQDPMPLFEKLTGKTAQQLWDEMPKPGRQ